MVTFEYNEARPPVLEGIDLQIRRGESVGIVGSTGSGKSTLVDLLVGLLPPSRGHVLIDGNDLQQNVRGWQTNCGMVSQLIFLSDDTLRRNIALGIQDDEIDQDALDQAVSVAQLETFVQQLPRGLETRVGERGVQLSGGQRQRVAIARAVYRNPLVFVLDEGTSALDNVTEGVVLAALKDLPGDRTIISVAHRITSVRDYDRIIFLQDGRIAGVGTYEQLRSTTPAFRQMTR
jgi:ATP-binding cassette subfamily C protein